MRKTWWLVVEDDDVDVMAIERGLRALGCAIELAVVPNGFEPVHQLRACIQEQGGPPDLIVLDINLPLANGHEILQLMAADPQARSIPKIVLTTSEHASDVQAAYAGGASGYFAKTADFGAFVKMLGSIVDYWSMATRP